MPPKRNHDDVDVDEDEEGVGEDDVQTIRIVSPSAEKRKQFMCELCSSVLKSASFMLRLHFGYEKFSYIYFIIRHLIILAFQVLSVS